MKSKRIAIYYVDGNMSSVSHMERVFAMLVGRMDSEGRQLRYVNERMAIFEDGTKIHKVPITGVVLGIRATDVYVDENIVGLKNGNKFIEEVVMPSVLPEGNYEHLEVKGEPSSRLLVFGANGINKYLGE